MNSPQAGADLAWQAADLLAVDGSGLGGLHWRGLGGLLPDAWVDRLRRQLPPAAAVRRLPLNIDDERLLGGLDLAATLATGRPVRLPGLLAQADGGVLLLPMAERLSAQRAAQLASVLDRGEVEASRSSDGAAAPARLALVALDDGQDDSEALPAALADRLGLRLDGAPRTPEPATPDADAARRRLPTVQVSDEALGALVQAAQVLGIGSLRAPLLALRVARASAALAGRAQADESDLALAAQLVLAPRALRLPAPPEPPPPDESSAEPPPPADEAEDQTTQPPPQPDPADLQDQVLQAALAALPPGLLALLAAGTVRVPGAGGRAGALAASKRRGRPVGSRRGDPRTGARLHLVDTLRAAAPWQAVRSRQAAQAAQAAVGAAAAAPGPRVHVRRDDFHIVRLRERRETTTVFVVDASGSAAMHRLAEAKGAVELLLAECYVRRDRVALIAFRGRAGAPSAELLLPPTRSLVRAKRSLADLPGGGGTPLAHGLDVARQLAEDLARRGGTPVVVLLSDGRANLARDGSPGRVQAHADALASARPWRALGLQVLWLDTAPQPQATAQEVAGAMGARYLPLPHADARQMAQTVSRAAG